MHQKSHGTSLHPDAKETGRDPAKKILAHNVKKSWNGTCTSKVIQPINTGRTENTALSVGILSPS